MKKKFPREFSFYPTTYVLPQSFSVFKTLFSPNGQSKGTYIIKPDGSAQGKGIFLTRRIEDVENLSSVCVAQQYLRNPLLIDKKKFDLRIYVLVTSCSPLRLYLFRDGLVRICTEEYKRPNTSNIKNRYMHLTNYSINKRSEKYERDDKESIPSNLGSKRSISWMLEWLGEEKSEVAAKKMWSKIGDICTMTIVSILPILRREYAAAFEKKVPAQNSSTSTEAPSGCHDETSTNDANGRSRCFEILGFDIMVDNDLRPSLIEVNHLPSWGTDSPIDEDIKSRVITQALSAVNVNARDKRYYENARRKQSQIRLGRKQSMSVSDDTDSQLKGNNLSTGKRQPTLFDSNSAERRIRLIYEKHAPEKLDKVKDLLGRYRGYEEWLAKKVEEKYNQNDDESTASSDEDASLSDDDDSTQFLDESERKKLEQEERILKDYDRIYPPSNNGRISLLRYREMEKFITEMDEKQQRRLLCPLQQMRPAGDSDIELNMNRELDRGDGWIRGNVHIRSTKEETKILGPPTKKQTESADRLSRGYSVEDSKNSEKSSKRKSRILHHDFIYEEENPFYHLIDRVKQSRELSKQTRKRAEKKLKNRSSKCGAAVKQQVLQLGLEIPFIEMEKDSKFYTKRKENEEFTL